MKNAWLVGVLVVVSVVACAVEQPAIQPVVTTPISSATLPSGAAQTTDPITETASITDPLLITPVATMAPAGTVTATASVTGSVILTPVATMAPAGTVTATAPMTGSVILTPTATVAPTDPVTATAVSPATSITATTPLTATNRMTGEDVLSDTSGMTIAQIIQGVDDFSSLAAALQQAGMAETLQGGGPFTVFAPTDEAFAVLPETIGDALLADNALLVGVLRYHIIADQADSARLAELGAAQAISSAPLTITVSLEGDLLVNDAQIVRSDISATNGVIHVIDRILAPPGLALAIPGAPAESISLADDTAQDETLAGLVAADTSGQSIVEIVHSINSVSVAARAIDASGLAEALAQPGPYTLFIPSDAAFAELPPATLESLLNSPTALAEAMQTHLVLDQVTSADLATLPVVLTAAGVELTVTVQDDGQILVNGAPVTQADIEAANGVIHIIGEVLTAPAP